MQWIVHRDVDASPTLIWDLLCDVTAWPTWGPTVRRAELETGATTIALGARGRVWTPIGLAMPFEITAVEPGRYWSWKVAGVPATGHAVAPRPGGARVSMSAPAWAPAYLPVLARALRRIEKLAAG